MSIKSNEVRIGNWLEDKEHFKGYFQVEGVAKYTVQSPLWTLELDEIAPITLTEEWLLKFGFEYIGICDDFPKGYYKHKALLEICFDNTFEPAVTGNDWGATYIMVPEMKYVHQLQNLFYALTGEELTINNP